MNDVRFELWLIDAWADGDDGWVWNDRQHAGSYTAKLPDTVESTVRAMLDDPANAEFDWYGANECEVRDREGKPFLQIVIAERRNP